MYYVTHRGQTVEMSTFTAGSLNNNGVCYLCVVLCILKYISMCIYAHTLDALAVNMWYYLQGKPLGDDFCLLAALYTMI